MASQHKSSTRQRGRKATTAAAAPKRTLEYLFAMGGVMLVLLLAAVVIGRQSAGGAETSGAPMQVATPHTPPNAEVNGRAWGPVDAPIQVIEYVDYECEACGMFARSYEAAVVAAFAASNQVRFEIRNAPFHGQGARNAAEASYCAADQDGFWPYHDSLFLNQPPHGSDGAAAFSKPRLTALAGQLGLDRTAFGQCLDQGRYTAQVEADYQATITNGVDQTPTFFVNGKKIVGVQSVDDFRRIFAQVAPDVTFAP